MRFICLIFILITVCLTTKGQDQSDTLRKEALRVFMYSNDYIKKEIPFVNYVRDLKEAQVYIVSTSQPTGSGGTEFTFCLTGQNEFRGMSDTVSYTSSPDDTFERKREKEVATLKMALMRYLLKTPLARYISIGFNMPIREEVTGDKWKSWVFSTSLNGYLNGQKTYNSSTVFGSFSAKKITRQWKLDFAIDYSNTTDNFDIGEEHIRSVNIAKSFNTMIIKSLGEHWSFGLLSEVGQSTYSNHDVKLSVMPGFEFNVFPYSQSTRKMFSFLYCAGYYYNDYTALTIYDRMEEELWGHTFETMYTMVEKWGYGYLGIEWKNYFHDWKMNNLSLAGSIDFRVAKGLSFNIGGGASIIHDQINLVKGGAPPEQILLKKKELETQYSYNSQVGLTYTFGSIYNNVVNPRFRNGGGTNRIIIN